MVAGAGADLNRGGTPPNQALFDRVLRAGHLWPVVGVFFGLGLLLTATNDRRLASQSTKFNIQKADAGEYPQPLQCGDPAVCLDRRLRAQSESTNNYRKPIR